MKKRFKTFIFALAAVLLVPTSTFASSGGPSYGAGQWDTIYDYPPINGNGGSTPILHSGGGDLRVCISGVNPKNTVTLYLHNDNNGIKEKSDFIIPPQGGFAVTNGADTPTSKFCFSKTDVRFYVDGRNNKAEIWVEATARFDDTVTVIVQD